MNRCDFCGAPLDPEEKSVPIAAHQSPKQKKQSLLPTLFGGRRPERPRNHRSGAPTRTNRLPLRAAKQSAAPAA